MLLRRLSVLIVLSLATCCTQRATAGPADARVRSALDVFALVVDPAYAFAVDACIAREALVADQVEAGKTAIDAATAELRNIRARCQATRRTFDSIRANHDRARELVEDGQLEEAERQLEQVRREWTELQTTGGARP
jgi:hypothetical protein